MDESLRVTVHRPSSSIPDEEVPLTELRLRFQSYKSHDFWSVEDDCRSFARMVTTWRDHELYKHFSGSWDEFLADHIQRPQEWVDQIIEGVALLDNSKPVSANDALQASIEKAKANPLTDHGAIGKGRAKDRHYNIMSKDVQGTSREYLARRLSRDNPEVLDEIGEGKKFKSVRQAAIATGIIKPKITVQFDPEESGGQIVSKLYQRLTDEQLKEMLENLLDYFGE